MSENTTFKSRRDCISFICDSISNNCKKQLENSTLKLGVASSKYSSNSKYINLYFTDRELNPFKDKMPYVVRVSDHQFTEYRTNLPDVDVRVKQVGISGEQKIRFDNVLHNYKKCRVRLITEKDSEVKKLLNEEIICFENEIEKIKSQIEYSFDGDLDSIVSEMKYVIMKNRG